MDEDLLLLTRVEAAKAGISMSKYLALAAREKINAANNNVAGKTRNLQFEAMERFLSGPKLHISVDGRMPTSEERNARR